MQKSVEQELNRWLDKTVGPQPVPTYLPVSPQGHKKERGRKGLEARPPRRGGGHPGRPSDPAAVELCPRHAGASFVQHSDTKLVCKLCEDEMTERESRVSKIVALCGRLFVTLELHGMRSIKTHPWCRFAALLCSYDLEDKMEAYLKWKLACIFCWLMDQEEFPDRPAFVPETDRRDVIVGGGVYCFLQQVKRGSTRVPRETVASSLLQFKKACPAVSDSFLEKSMKSSGNQLCETATCPEDRDVDDSLWGHDDCPTPGRCLCHHFTLSALEREVARTCREVFPRSVFHDTPRFSGPSMRGHYAWGRRRGGALLPVAQLLRANQEWNPERKEIPIWVEECIQPEPIPQTVEVRLSELEQDFYAELVGIKEPFKVRTISKGPPRAYYVSKYLQKVLWKRVQEHPTFQLVGRPLSSEILGRSLGRLAEGEVWVSGDYKSATDLLHPRLSEAAVTAISSQLHLSPGLQKIFRQALTGHLIVTDRGEPSQQIRVQQWGQLMGSPLSFPVLCLVNAAVTRRVLELTRGGEWTRPLSLRRARILVNGDDIGFALDRCWYPLWGYATRKAGLHKSVGKNYTSPEFIVLNSETHMYRPKTLPVGVEGPLGLDWEFCPWINGALLFGLTPKGSESWDTRMPVTPESTLGLGDRLRDLLRCANQHFDLDRLRTIFIREHADFLALTPPGVDWVIPPILGGLGLDLPNRAWSVRGRRRAAYVAQSNEELFQQSLKDSFARKRNPALLALAYQEARKRGRLVSNRQLGYTDEVAPIGGYLYNAVLSYRLKKKRDVDLDELEDARSQESLIRSWTNGVNRQLRLSREWQPQVTLGKFDDIIADFLEFPRKVCLLLEKDNLPPLIHLRDDPVDLLD